MKLMLAGPKPVGVTIVGRHAGDLLLPWNLVLGGKASLFALAEAVVAYPTRSEASKSVAFDHYRPRIFSPPVRLWARLLARLRHRR